jgi:hypothetical protein
MSRACLVCRHREGRTPRTCFSANGALNGATAVPLIARRHLSGGQPSCWCARCVRPTRPLHGPGKHERPTASPVAISGRPGSASVLLLRGRPGAPRPL